MSNNNQNKHKKIPDYNKTDVNALNERRLRNKDNFLSRFTLYSRKLHIRLSFFLITAVFIFIILWISINFENTEKFIVVLVLLSFAIFELPNAIGSQIWNTEKSKVMIELNPWSIKTFLHTFGTYIRWILPLAALSLIFLIIGGVIKGY